MFESAGSLVATQTSRAMQRREEPRESPIRAAFLESFRRRNATLDAMFYDVGAVSDEEARKIGPHLAHEGAILVVPPTGQGELSLCPTLEDYLAHGEAVKTLAVAGVGSSALGTAAFARNVADATGTPVAGVVSGYGMADLMTEALGGYFWFGALNSMRHAFELFDDWARLPDTAPESQTHPSDAVRKSKDTRTVRALLEDETFGFDLLVGHSKGNLVISEALYEMQDEESPRLDVIGANTHIVTISARIVMPRACKRVTDIFGEWDWFGDLNSRQWIKPDLEVEQAWHHTNPEIPAHLPVTHSLRKVL